MHPRSKSLFDTFTDDFAQSEDSTHATQPLDGAQVVNTTSLEELGWQPWFAQDLPVDWSERFRLGRVAMVARDRIQAFSLDGDIEARYRISTHGEAQLPAVGDWVLLSMDAADAEIAVKRILPRRTSFSRGAAGNVTVEQVVAANVDTVFLVESLETLNPRRLERALVAAWSSGARPVILVNKADLAGGSDAPIRDAERVGHGVPVHPISAKFDADLTALIPYCRLGQTIALIGSSGAGKSTLVNRLVGSDVARTGEVRGADRRGRHTTTHRELIRMPHGGLIIDTPGLRELQLWDARGGVARAFNDVEALAGRCRFRDCRHASDDGCAVREAIDVGLLDPKRLASYQKLVQELTQLEARVDERARTHGRQKPKAVHSPMRNVRSRP
ncbi:MAG: ribosome small subunit-dependent GTPase A [Chloroflexota bacterium]